MHYQWFVDRGGGALRLWKTFPEISSALDCILKKKSPSGLRFHFKRPVDQKGMQKNHVFLFLVLLQIVFGIVLHYLV